LTASPSLTIVMPVYNEAAGIGRVVSTFYEEIVQKTGAEFTIGEDGSTDGTKEILQRISSNLPIVLYLGSERKGYARAAKDILRKANSPFVFFSDSDGQYAPADFWSLWDERQAADLIIGRKVSRADGMHRIILSKAFHAISRALFGVKLHDMDCGFRLVRRSLLLSILDAVDVLEYSFWAEFTIRANAVGARILEAPIRQLPRTEGESRIYTWKKLPLIVTRQLIGLLQLKLELIARNNTAKEAWSI
jgi:glycosyltransferase involved in cell wall biosynthesis